MAGTRRISANLSRGFSLVELLVVIVIIVIVIALLLPAIGGVRDIAKATTTTTRIREFGNAVDGYRQDNNGARPGVFTEQEMGSSENADSYGFTAQENMILELAGGITRTDGGLGGGGGSTLKNFGPTQAAHDENTDLGRFVREDWIGTDYEGNPGYFQPDPKFFVKQSRPNGQFGAGAGISNNEADIPDFVDAWGNPVLVWVEDGFAPPVEDDPDQFAREDSDGDDPALYYWASNAGYLKATELGRSGKDQNRNNNDPYSLIGGDARNLETSVTGLLGNSASPLQDLDASSLDELIPASSRGEIIVQSAGTNGLFLGTKERASKMYDAEANGLRYGMIYYTSGSTRRIDASGTTGTADLIDGFDDVILSFGN